MAQQCCIHNVASTIVYQFLLSKQNKKLYNIEAISDKVNKNFVQPASGFSTFMKRNNTQSAWTSRNTRDQNKIL